jgi:hypothetical protein
MATETYAEKQARLRRQRNKNFQSFAIAGMQAWSARKSAKYTAQARQNTGTDLAKLRKEATVNGFNPLTVLRATGGQGFTRDPDVGKLASSAFYNSFSKGIGDAYYNNMTLNNQQNEPISPYKPMDEFLDPELKIDGTKRYFKKKDGTDTEIEIGTNLLDLSFDQIMQIRAEDFEEQYGDLAQIVFGVIRLGSDIVDVTKQKAAIKKAIEKHKRRNVHTGAGDRSGIITKSKLSEVNLYSDTLKTLNKSKYKNKSHPRNTNRGNHGALAPQ